MPILGLPAGLHGDFTILFGKFSSAFLNKFPNKPFLTKVKKLNLP